MERKRKYQGHLNFGALRSLVTVFLSFVPVRILSRSAPRSPEPPDGGAGGGGGGGGGGAPIIGGGGGGGGAVDVDGGGGDGIDEVVLATLGFVVVGERGVMGVFGA